MPGRKGNVEKVMADAQIIADKLRNSKESLNSLCRQYHCGFSTLCRAVYKIMSHDEVKKISKRKNIRNTGGGNIKIVETNAEKIVNDLHCGNIFVYELIKKYNCSYRTLKKIILRHITMSEYRSIKQANNIRGAAKAKIQTKKTIQVSSKITPQDRINHRLEKQQKIDKQDAEKISEFRRQIKTVGRWQCCGCGEDYEVMPDICSKCNGLHFERIEIPVSKKQETENLTKAA